MSKEENRKAALERVENARKKMQEDREKFAKDAPKITKQLLEGVNYKEEIPVLLKNGDYGILEISALSESELLEAFAVLGMDKLQSLGEDGAELGIEDYDFFWTLIALSTGLDKELIKHAFAMGESSMVGQRILEISGATGEDVETFPEK